MSTFSERRQFVYYLSEFIWHVDEKGLCITEFMNLNDVPRFVQPIIMQGLGLMLTWDWYVPIPETQPSAQFIPALCICGHLKRDHSDEFSGACTVSIDPPVDCPCAGFEWSKVKR